MKYFCSSVPPGVPGSLPVRGAWIEILQSRPGAVLAGVSLPVRGAWIEISRGSPSWSAARSRSPCGERGLKLCGDAAGHGRGRSLPVRGAWIEMRQSPAAGVMTVSLPVRGAWIEIAAAVNPPEMNARRSPCGERGLKFRWSASCHRIERRSPCGERGLKYPRLVAQPAKGASLPVRGAWIEISAAGCAASEGRVAPRAGSVD